ncbi:PREDICTED: transmembrane protein 47-like [Branchiostoma belcheri]|uniref:Transmembrane protein 47-like n=1 Tax=Branchiostoma belcheri TaxID=7741 RepID=A0A6P5AMC9_BRABE|nr:PREDICTED: transmembrane protein 47-like [Branchiostoma belcheri]
MATEVKTTTRVVRPMKLIGLICSGIAWILMIVCLASDYWVRSDTVKFYQGLWNECGKVTDATPPPTDCTPVSAQGQAYVQASAAFLILNLLLALAGFVLGLMAFFVERFRGFYKWAGLVLLVAVLFALIALIVFPAMFHTILTEQLSTSPTALKDRVNWELGWGYGVGWGASFFMIGAALLFLFGKDTNEIYETTSYEG